jgi:hypothetical protein
MHLSDFHVKNDDWPLVASTDELIIVHKNALSVEPIIFIGAPQEAVIQIRSATDRSLVEAAAPWATINLVAGGKTSVRLPGTGNPLHVVSKITLTRGAIFVSLGSFGEFDAYFKQITVSNA